MINFEKAKSYVFVRLERELPGNLFYHGIHHTREDVLPATERLAGIEGILGYDLLLLKTAALYHDIGYVERYQGNEPIGVRIAKESLPTFGYSSREIDRIGEIIMATQVRYVDGKLVQSADRSDLLQKIMCDADLDSLGRDDFFSICHNLKRELSEQGVKKNLKEWYEFEILFLQNHEYYTNAARRLRNGGKLGNLEEIRRLFYVGGEHACARVA